MATTDTNVPQVIVNKLTKAQYEAAVKDPTEFYAVTDGKIETADIADGAVTSAKMGVSASMSGGNGSIQMGSLLAQWKSFAVSGTPSSWGGIYYYDLSLTTADKTWATAFSSAPIVQISTSGTAGVQCWASCNSPSATTMGDIRVFKPVSTDIDNVTVTVLAIGNAA